MFNKSILILGVAAGILLIDTIKCYKIKKHVGGLNTSVIELIDIVNVQESQIDYLIELVNREGIALTEFDKIALSNLNIETKAKV